MYGKPYRRKNCAADKYRKWLADFIGGKTAPEIAENAGVSEYRVREGIRRRLQGVPAFSAAEMKRRRGINSGRKGAWPDCPPNLQAEYKRLQGSYNIPAAEARRMLEQA